MRYKVYSELKWWLGYILALILYGLGDYLLHM